MLPKLTSKIVLMAILLSIGCRPLAEPSVDDDLVVAHSMEDAMEQLRSLQPGITASIERGNPAAADGALHDAMYLADRVRSLAPEERANREMIRQRARELFDLLLAAHNAAHGHRLTHQTKEEFVADLEAGFGALADAVDSQQFE